MSVNSNPMKEMWKKVFSLSSSSFVRSPNPPNTIIPFIPKPSLHHKSSFYGVLSKVFLHDPTVGRVRVFSVTSHRCFHSGNILNESNKDGEPLKQSESGSTTQDACAKVKRKKLKGKRAVVRWLKHFRYKKKKEQERMTPEEKLLYKLNKVRKKEARLVEALKNLEPKEWSETTHDPEVLTPEEHFYFLKMGIKCKNYVPVGRRGIYQGVILNMHLHWKKHQTLQVIVKTFTPVEVKEIAADLARLTGGIVLDIHEENTIIMYRGKNYSQPPTEIMSPRVTLPRKKALDKSRHRDALRAVRRYIPKLEQELELLRAQARNEGQQASAQNEILPKIHSQDVSSQPAPSDKLKELMDQYNTTVEDENSSTEANIDSDSEDLSDIFETDSDGEVEQPMYLHEFDKFPSKIKDDEDDSEQSELSSKGSDLADFDEVDQMFLRAAELLKKKRR